MKIFAIALLAIASTACMSRAAENSAAVENDEETVEAFETVRTWRSDTRITPDATMPIVIDFNATWCGPCRYFAPVFHEAAKAHASQAIFLSVDVDECPAAAKQFGVTGIPQMSVLRPDGSVTSAMGYMDLPEFEAWLTSALK